MLSHIITAIAAAAAGALVPGITAGRRILTLTAQRDTLRAQLAQNEDGAR